MIRSIALTVTVLTLALAAPAHAESPETTQDLKCLAVGFALIQSPDPAVVDAAKVATFYYLGRIDGREPALDLADRLSKPDMQLTQEDLQKAAAICGDQLGARGKQLMEASKKLEAMGR